MHNRIRMIVGSFLVKNLQINWIKCAKYFWEKLLDTDLVLVGNGYMGQHTLKFYREGTDIKNAFLN